MTVINKVLLSIKYKIKKSSLNQASLLGFLGFIVLISIWPFLAFAQLNDSVVDDAKMISSANRTEIEQDLATLRENQNIWLVVWTTPHLSGETIEAAAAHRFKEWNIGEKGKDNGLLLVVAVKERKVRLEVGYGLEGDIPDIKAKHLVEDLIRPSLRNSDLASGIKNLISKLREPTISNEQVEENVPSLTIKENNGQEFHSPKESERNSLVNLLYGLEALVILLCFANGVEILWKIRALKFLKMSEQDSQFFKLLIIRKAMWFLVGVPFLSGILCGTVFLNPALLLIASVLISLFVLLGLIPAFQSLALKSIREALFIRVVNPELRKIVTAKFSPRITSSSSNSSGGGSSSSSKTNWSSGSSGSSGSMSGGGRSGGGGASSDW